MSEADLGLANWLQIRGETLILPRRTKISNPRNLHKFSSHVRIYAERGATDLAVTSGLSPVGVVPVLLGNGDGTFRSALTYGAGSAPASLAVGDLNGDGKPDLAMTGGLGDNVTVLLNTYVSGSGGSVCAPATPLAN